LSFVTKVQRILPAANLCRTTSWKNGSLKDTAAENWNLAFS